MVGKRQVTDTERVRDTVRREEARVEETGDAQVRERGERTREPWRGKERRLRRSTTYSGPERRLVPT